MNDRIHKIAEQAEILFSPSSIPETGFNYLGADISIDDLEKFAELIVKEYEKFLPEVCPWVDADKEGPMKGWHVQFVARKHFGVEE